MKKINCPGNVLSRKLLSEKMTVWEMSFRETSIREADYAGNICKPRASPRIGWYSVPVSLRIGG